MPLRAGDRSVPDPDVAVVAGDPFDDSDAHPTSALLVVEVADSSLPQDRLTKSRIYTAASIPEYWIVNLRERCVEVLTGPEREQRICAGSRRVERREVIELVGLSGAVAAVPGMLPGY